jgi:uncharacterized SAM-binding protein YcdF (DUF218 family)
MRQPRKFWGLLTRREGWALSWRGWLLLVLFLLLAGSSALLTVHPFLAVTQRVDTKVLVVEGWVHEFAIRAAAEEFKTGAYQRVVTTGGPVTGNGGYTGDQDTGASVGAALLRKAGVPPESLQMAPSRVMERDRTYQSAVALRDWFRENRMVVSNLNVVTVTVHARRTRLLYQKAFGKDVAVGIIAVPNPDYEPDAWWRYSEGVREVMGESIAYLYARFLFNATGPKADAR